MSKKEETKKTRMKTYQLVEREGHKGIICKYCKLTSYNANDVKYLYCGYCHRFHKDVFI